MIVVNSNTRQFNVPGADMTFGVEADAGSERKYFQSPRYVGNNLDLAGCFIRINYRNANGEVDSYLVNDVTVEGDNITFSWALTPKVTAYKGQIKFVMCVTGPDTKVAWHTTLGVGVVLEGLEPDYVAIQAGTADVVAQLIALVEQQTAAVTAEGTKQVGVVKTAAKTAQDDAVAQVEAKGASTLATIPGDYTATVSAVQSAANAIRKKVSGEVIRVDDVSPMEHYPEINAHGKNLIPFPYYHKDVTTQQGVNITVDEDGTITLNGTALADTAYRLMQNAAMPVKGTFTLSGCDGGSTTTYYLQPFVDGVGTSALLSGSKTYEWDGILTSLAFFFKKGTVFENMRFKPQLERGKTATEYTPYVDPTTVKVRRCGRNIIPPEYSEGNLTRSGITWETLSDGRVKATGTTDSTGTYLSVVTLVSEKLHLMSGVTYHFSCIPTKDGTCYAYVKDANSVNFFDRGNGATFTPTVSGPAAVTIVVSSNATVSGVVFSPMLEVTSKASAFEQSESETQIPTANGTVSGLTAVSPTMTLLTDTAGVTIDCEYSRDTNVVIAEILEKITALGG